MVRSKTADGPGAAGQPSPALLDVGAFAELLGVSTRTVRRLVDAGKCPPPLRLGGCVRWHRQVVDTWLADGCPNCRKRQGVTR